MARQVVQIAADTGQIYALCDDGEVFRFSGETWHHVSPIPQGDPREAAKLKQKIGFVLTINPASKAFLAALHPEWGGCGLWRGWRCRV